MVALVLGAALVFGANYVVAGRLAWTPGGFALSFGRMLQDGIVNRYLDDHCPDPTLQLCAYKDQLPPDADVFFWGRPLFDKLGRFDGLGDEMEHNRARQPASNIRACRSRRRVADTAEQLIDVRTGEGVVNIDLAHLWHHRALHAAAGARDGAARQQQGEIAFAAINRMH